MDPIAVTTSVLQIDPLIRLVSNGGGHGAVATFIGVVRDNNLNRRVTHLEYEAYESMAVKALAQVCREAIANGRVHGWRSPSHRNLASATRHRSLLLQRARAQRSLPAVRDRAREVSLRSGSTNFRMGRGCIEARPPTRRRDAAPGAYARLLLTFGCLRAALTSPVPATFAQAPPCDVSTCGAALWPTSGDARYESDAVGVNATRE